MLKWIGGILLVIVLLIGTCTYVGYSKLQKFAGDDGPATTMVAASADRVFAALATGDSIPEWMSVSGSVRPSRHGLLKLGDTVTVIQAGATEKLQRSNWIVTDVTLGKLLVLQMRNDSLGIVAATRNFALEVRGDSTAIISTVASPMLDAAKGAQRDSSAMMSFASKMMLAAMRMQAKLELAQLKTHLEGVPASSAPQP
jgi:uncharacterized protein YndB with AHSA1/START domain